MEKNQEEITAMDLDNFKHYEVLLDFSSVTSSIRLGLFDFLDGKDYTSISEIKSGLKLGANERNILDFLDVLYLNRHLLREGNGLDAKYKLRHNFYVKSNPKNLGMSLILFEKVIKETELLDEHLLTGKVSSKKENIFDYLAKHPEHSESFLISMGTYQEHNFIKVSEAIDFSKYQNVVDVGGCLGNCLSIIKKKFDHLKCTNFDLPYVEEQCLKYVKNQGLEGKIEFIKGDFFKDELPKSDVIIMGNILHDWNLEKKKFLIKKAYESLSENGIFIIIEEMVKEERDQLDGGMIDSYCMVLYLAEGFNMSKNETKNYAIKAGFKKIEFLDELCGGNGAICYKN